MIRYKAGFKFIDGGVHAQVLDFPAVITCANDLSEARHLLTMALLDVAETCLEHGQSLPTPNPQVTDPDMDLEEPIYVHLCVSTDVAEMPAGEVAS